VDAAHGKKLIKITHWSTLDLDHDSTAWDVGSIGMNAEDDRDDIIEFERGKDTGIGDVF
jgi:hypothetical protein